MNRRCSRPGCGYLASTTLSFRYERQIVWIDDLHAEDSPANHDLCAVHANRTRPPRGWALDDRRSRAAASVHSPEAVSPNDASSSLRRAG